MTLDEVLQGARLLGLDVRWQDGHVLAVGPKGPQRDALVKVIRLRKEEFLERFQPPPPRRL